jgi:hypothetical protein
LADDKKLNQVIASVFATPGGQELMRFLRQITTNVAAGPEVTDQYLRHLEGQRYLVALIQQRIDIAQLETKIDGNPQGKARRARR